MKTTSKPTGNIRGGNASPAKAFKHNTTLINGVNSNGNGSVNVNSKASKPVIGVRSK